MKLLRLVESAKDSVRRLSEVEPVFAKSHPMVEISVDPQKTGHNFLGFGGAMTESAAMAFTSMDPVRRLRALKDYFDPDAGHGYVYCRVPLGSSDFSQENWSHVPSAEDSESDYFAMDRFDALTLPVLKEALEISKGRLKLKITPWSPPAWMKTNGERNHGGKLKPEYRTAWARQYARFIVELKTRGFETWAVSIQNEPEAVQRWDSCIWTGTEEAEFARDFLRPALDAAGLKRIKILLWDHNRDRLFDRATESLAVEGAMDVADGFAYHWYLGDHFHNLKKTAEQFPEKLLVFSEGCVEGGPRPGAWYTGERYGHCVAGDLNHGAHAWIDWNLALDRQGGPNHARNFCDAPILVDTDKGVEERQSSFWYLGQFSRFVRPGAMALNPAVRYGMLPASPDGMAGLVVDTTAFKNVDGTVSVIFSNRSEADAVYRINVNNGSQERYDIVCPPRAIQSLSFSA